MSEADGFVLLWRVDRDAGDGFRLYEEVYHQEVSLAFFKEPHIKSTRRPIKKAMLTRRLSSKIRRSGIILHK